MTNTYKEIRLNAKSHWHAVTKRRRNKTQMNDDINNAFECNWQRDLVPPDKHASIFCSIGEWATSITDFLHDSRFDDYTFSSERQRLALFRHYIDMEIGTLKDDFIGGKPLIKYLRYNFPFTVKNLNDLGLGKIFTEEDVENLVEMSNAENRQELYKIGEAASSSVLKSHFE